MCLVVHQTKQSAGLDELGESSRSLLRFFHVVVVAHLALCKIPAMKAFTALVSVVLAVSGALAQDALTINTP